VSFFLVPESRARRKIREAVEAKGYSLVELTWEPWGKAAEKEGISGGWWGRVEPDPSTPGSSGLDWFGGLSWQEAVESISFMPARVADDG
jgi:hypothetical protein